MIILELKNNSNIVFYFELCYNFSRDIGSVSEWLKEADCKSVALCYVGSNPTRPTTDKVYIPVIFWIIKIINIQNRKKLLIKKRRSFGILNKFLKGVMIIRINPAKLLIKNRGYLEMFVQKSFIII